MDQQKEENQMDVTESIRQPHQHALLYSVDDVPPWHLSCLLGFQVNDQKSHSKSVLVIPLIPRPFWCVCLCASLDLGR